MQGAPQGGLCLLAQQGSLTLTLTLTLILILTLTLTLTLTRHCKGLSATDLARLGTLGSVLPALK
eukprot:scaffold10431_cov45-Phaeocystis_antarctica.AAC.1